MHCIVLRHLAFEDLGLLADVLTRKGFVIDYRQAGVDAIAEGEWDDAELVVVLGGPIGVYEDGIYPWLGAEIAGIARRLQHGRPTLGICLGAQLMAAALGARVYPGPAKEIGWSALALTEAGRASCLSALENEPVLHWHGDTFDLPAGADLLASSALTPHQAFSCGDKVLALQFHPEVFGPDIEPWLIGHVDELKQAAIDIPTLREQSHAARGRAGAILMENWLQGCGWKD
ncbi:glutamine amidotransferase [Paludibacterium yongneupense]|uniref:glutamine amidotransferase n=1 Tax=Paludibacterium yongneupense TaxID=400061 RepID=UPI0004003855|nr:glutamine amidotransferase [Paludibacterium yongneupense]